MTLYGVCKALSECECHCSLKVLTLDTDKGAMVTSQILTFVTLCHLGIPGLEGLIKMESIPFASLVGKLRPTEGTGLDQNHAG